MPIGLWGDRVRKYIKKVRKTRKKMRKRKKIIKKKYKGKKKRGGRRSRKNNISKYLPWIFEKKTRKRRK